MALQRDYLRGFGGLVKLSPLRASQPDFYRILGSDVTIAYLQSLLKNPEEARQRGPAVWAEAQRNLTEIIEALSEESPEYKPLNPRAQIRETVINYFKKRDVTISLPETRRKFQIYAMMLENCHAGRRLTQGEEQEKQEVHNLLNFFTSLEQNYHGWERHQDALDDE